MFNDLFISWSHSGLNMNLELYLQILYNKPIWYQKGFIMVAEERREFTLRINVDLFEKVKKSAEKNKRSIAKEIEFALEQYVEK